MNVLKFQKETLSNGLRIIKVPMPWTEAVTLLTIFGVGSRHEPEKLSGVSHFIEHMMFKGTKKRPNTLAISRELDRVGAEYNAFTSKDHTGYWIKISKNHFDLALDVLFDMLLESKFDKVELEREKHVIREEIKMYDENPLMHIDALFEQIIFDGHPLGRDIAGTEKIVAAVSRDELVNFKKSFYRPEDTVIVVAGNLDKQAFSHIKKYGQQFSTKSKAPGHLDEFSFKKRDPLLLHYQKLDQAQLALGFPAYNYLHPHLPALKLLSIILGGSMSSRLFIEVRERRGLAYFVRSEVDSYSDTGSFKVRAGIDANRTEEAIKVIVAELKKILQGVSIKELDDAKEFVRGHLALSLEDSNEQADWCGKQELLLGDIKTPKEKMAEIDRVDLREIKSVANEIIKIDCLRCALIGPFKDKSKFLKLIK